MSGKFKLEQFSVEYARKNILYVTLSSFHYFITKKNVKNKVHMLTLQDF